MKKLLISLFTVAALAIACSENEEILAQETLVIKANVEADQNGYKTLFTAREKYQGEFFDILNVKRDVNLLRIFVEGPCDTEGYAVVCDNTINFMEPPTANLIVSYESKSQIQCLAIMQRTIEIDLKKTFGDRYTDNLVINVANASKKYELY